ncbi:hypothetical protein N7519_006138 [Penicillium mononematosum]|uniref:uncharacterized protein n=1 Tax=Penicillium mononematosum TaxID=268346 RepID=UPI0025482AB6|nr:uncharacterized protein N7519_006138 [Penicillium mononematosum]KAJ6184837.1 hypothetical protein N7519_006138 [Penicillium mononematosum]
MADSLPLETLQEIFSYQTGHLASCACVCRQWQVAAERFTFADLHISSADLEDFRQMFPVSNSTGRRFHLRSLHFKVVIPKYSIAARGQYENQDDRDSNNNAFTRAITSLFEILSSWPEYDRYMLLQIYVRSPSDWQAEPDWTIRRTRFERGRAFPEEELLQRRYQDSYLQLMGKIALPDVKCITSLDVMGCENFRNIAPGAVSEMVIHLPRLQTVTATLRDKVRNGTEMGDSLGDFPRVAARWPSSLRHLRLRYEPRQPYGEDYSPHSTPGPNSRSLALCQMTQQLEVVDLSETTIGPDLFWPVDANITPFWPNLIKLTIMYSRNSASRDHTADLTDEDLRTALKSKDLDELSLAAGRAAQHMPRLQSMEIDLSLSSVPTAHYYFIYVATLGKVTWAVTSQFYVSKKAQQAWDVAAKRHGNALPSVEVCDMDTYSSDSSLSS